MAEHRSTTKEEKCIFCEIAQGHIEPLGNGKFWENGKYMAWLSPFPNTEGFTVVIPKKHFASDVLAMPDHELAEFLLTAKKVSSILLKYFSDVGRVGLIMEGTGVDHAHIKLFPMHGTDILKKEWRQYESSINIFFTEYQGYISSHSGPRYDDEEIKSLAKKLKYV